MKITNIKVGTLEASLKKPFKTALRTVERVESVLVRVETDEGATGYGEAPPTAVITGDVRRSIEGALLDHLAPPLLGRPVEDLEGNLALVDRALVHNTSPKAALDMALHDLWAQRWHAPLWRLLGGAPRTLETDCTISLNPPEEMARDAAEAVAEGFHILKIKVGRDPKLDRERLHAVRRAAPKAALRVDANQGWTTKEAIRILRALEDDGLDIDLVEQPVPGYDLEGLKAVTDAVAVPVLADEAAVGPREVFRLLAMRGADMINIKLMKTGGIRGALAVCALAEAAGVEVMVGSMMETRLSVTAAVALAASRNVVTRVDLDTPCLCADDPVEGGALYDGPRISLWETPGLGITGVRSGRGQPS